MENRVPIPIFFNVYPMKSGIAISSNWNKNIPINTRNYPHAIRHINQLDSIFYLKRTVIDISKSCLTQVDGW